MLRSWPEMWRHNLAIAVVLPFVSSTRMWYAQGGWNEVSLGNDDHYTTPYDTIRHDIAKLSLATNWCLNIWKSVVEYLSFDCIRFDPIRFNWVELNWIRFTFALFSSFENDLTRSFVRFIGMQIRFEVITLVGRSIDRSVVQFVIWSQ